MKKSILSLTLLLSTASLFSQTWDFNNEPELNTNHTMFLVDTTGANYSALTGAGQTWDYSMLGGYADNTRIVSVESAELYLDIFPDATHMQMIPGFMNTFYNYEPNNDKFAHGVEFELPDLGAVQFIYNDKSKMLQFPMTLGTTFEDDFDGTLILLDEPNTAVGTTWVTVDGTGTLLLANNASHTDVMRIRTIDTIYAEIELSGLPFPTSATIVREQYDYVKAGTANYPLFTHATLTVINPLIGQIKIGVVLSTKNPSFFVGTPNFEQELFKIYPNPSTANFNIQLPSLDESTSVLITDLQGSTIYSDATYQNNQTINLDGHPAGVYFVHIQQQGATTVQKLIKQ